MIKRCINCTQKFVAQWGVYFCAVCLKAAEGRNKDDEKMRKRLRTNWKNWQEYVLQAQRSAERNKK